MSEKEEPKEDQKVENLNFSFQDILGDDEVNTNNHSFQSIVQTFRNEDNQSASYNNLPAELQHLFSLSESNASSDIQMWNNNDAVSSPHSAVSTPSTNQPPPPPPPFVTQSPMRDPTSSPTQSINSQPSLSSLKPQQNSPQLQESPQSIIHASPQVSNEQLSSPQQPSPQTIIHSPLNTASPQVTVQQSPLAHVQSPIVASPAPQVIAPQQQNTMSQSPQIAARPSPAINQSPVVIAPQQHIQPIMPQQQIQPQPTNNTQQNTGGGNIYKQFFYLKKNDILT